MRALSVKTTLLVAALVFSIETIAAEDPCLSISLYSETVMKARQQELPMSDAMPASDGKLSKEATQIIRQIVIAAYERPAYSSPEYQAKAIAKFKNDIYLDCVKAQ